MDGQSILWVIIIGAIAGWLAGQIVRGFGFGILVNILLGILGSFVGYWLFGQLGISFGSGILSTILTSTIGAILVLVIVGLIRRAG